ncbi:unnamed protein product [Prorocentrum cordatum]|uniref:Zinc finger C2H2 LYAR-type domain-containing protein n=1 Tax=Prorocentrum cordatum TaxID=2364126 RepID=A0ABN9T9K0_9DINO|nr:unnamed protein product [Polarella glacialis]
MVYFECQKCNETVKKPKLARHLQVCGSGYVSCIDCSKVFAWNEWESHTSCVSEAQKYQGKLYEAKEDNKKGQVKQDAWIDNIEKKIADPASGISPQTKGLLQKLLGFNNIPRKQKPFGNFVKNSVKIWDEKKISEMWEVINSANKAPANASAGATAPNGANAAAGASDAAATAAAKPAAAAAAAAGAKAAGAGASAWRGWKRALDEELQSAPGNELPWKRLRDALVQRYCSEHVAKGENSSDNLVEFAALACIPEAYLSKSDGLVRLPDKASDA